MSAVTPDVVAGGLPHEEHPHHPTGIMRWITTTNHKDIGTMYLWFSFTMFIVGGVMALTIRAELFQPGLQIVHPAPTPLDPGSPSTNIEVSSSANDAGRSQNEMLFMRGNAMSGAPIISGTIQLPKPPIIAGMTMKKIMISPCAVVKTS